jgi:hypothetical protein
MPTDDRDRPLDTAPYKVGYGKPPLETRFGAHRQPDRSKRHPPKDQNPDIAALLDQPLEVRIKGKRTKMHPHEAMLRGLFKRVLIGETRAIKEFLELFARAGLIDPAVATLRSVIEAPEEVPLELAGLLIREVGLPPWREEIIAPYRAEYDRELANIAALKAKAIERARANGEEVY